jgi:hypothetical protein
LDLIELSWFFSFLFGGNGSIFSCFCFMFFGIRFGMRGLFFSIVFWYVFWFFQIFKDLFARIATFRSSPLRSIPGLFNDLPHPCTVHYTPAELSSPKVQFEWLSNYYIPTIEKSVTPKWKKLFPLSGLLPTSQIPLGGNLAKSRAKNHKFIPLWQSFTYNISWSLLITRIIIIVVTIITILLYDIYIYSTYTSTITSHARDSPLQGLHDGFSRANAPYFQRIFPRFIPQLSHIHIMGVSKKIYIRWNIPYSLWIILKYPISDIPNSIMGYSMT